MAELSDADVFGAPAAKAPDAPKELSDADVFAPSAPPHPSLFSAALKPITDIPAEYSQAVQQGLGQMSRGVSQIETGSPWEVAKGIGNVGLGALGYATAPITAPVHAIVGKPIAEVTGSPLAGELAEIATGFALPVPKGLPVEAAIPEESAFGITLTPGEKAGDLALRQREASAMRNLQDAGAQAFVEQRKAEMNAANKALVQGLDPFGQTLVTTPQEAGQIASEAVQSAARAAKGAVQRGYTEARAMPGEISASAFQGIGDRIKERLSGLPEPVVIDQATAPNASKMMDFLDQKVRALDIPNKAGAPVPSGSEITGVNLAGIDQWRKALSAMRRDAMSPADRRAAQAVLDAFDAQIDDAVNNGQFSGNSAAINAWNNARAAYADYRSTFGPQRGDAVGNVVQKIIGKHPNEPLPPSAVIDQIIGASSLRPSPLSVGVANRLKGILGPASTEWMAVRQGALQRLIETPEGKEPLGPAGIAGRLGEFLARKDMANVLYSPQEQQTLQSYANLMRSIAMPARGYAPSEPAIMRLGSAIASRLGGILGAVIGHSVSPYPLMGELAGYTVGKQAERLAERHLGNVSKQLPIVADQWAAYSRAKSAAMAQPQNPLLQRAALGATVGLRKALAPLGVNLDELVQQGPGTTEAQPNQQEVPRAPRQQRDGGKAKNEESPQEKNFHPRMIGAKQAKDGEWYIPDPQRPGKFLKVIPRA